MTEQQANNSITKIIKKRQTNKQWTSHQSRSVSSRQKKSTTPRWQVQKIPSIHTCTCAHMQHHTHTHTHTHTHSGGGGVFFLTCEDFLVMLDHSFLTCAFCFVLFLKWRLACPHEFNSLFQDQSIVAQWAETTVAECSLASWVWAHFQIGSHTMSEQWHSQPASILLGQGCTRV